MKILKACPQCSVLKPVEEFYFSVLDGRESGCKDCEAFAKPQTALTERQVKKRLAWRKWAAAHPERTAAQQELRIALRAGKVVPWMVCAVSDCDIMYPEAHHPDYSRPLDVVWLCHKHHSEIHRKGA